MDIVNYDEPFYSPFNGSVLIKAEEHNGEWDIYLQASNEGLDQEQEYILMKALQDQKDYYLTHGVISWDHKHKALHDPLYIIGEPKDVAFSNKNETLVKGVLYQKNELAKHLWDNIQSDAKMLGSSVGGGILRKSKDGGITKVIWDDTAITHKPVNDKTLGNVQVIAFKEFAKALMAGAGVDASMFTGGRALSSENLDKELRDATFAQSDTTKITLPMSYEASKKYFEDLFIRIKDGKITCMKEVIQYTLDRGFDDSATVNLLKFVMKKIPEFKVGGY